MEAWRSRQIASISLGGRARVLGTSRKDERVLMPGGFVLFCAGDEETLVAGAVGGGSESGIRGAGGGGGKGEVDGVFCFADWSFSL